MRIGFVVNPIAGMGGAVALKGTDGPEILREAIARGAKRVAPERAVAALREIKKRGLDIDTVTAAGEMGRDELEAAGLESRVVVTSPSRTSGEDTIRAVKAFLADGVELVLFVGGDGTARDVLSAADADVPILGVPAGVKMHSSVFALSPERAADALAAFLETGRVKEAEVMDVDEDGFREGVLRARLYGVAKVPDDSSSIQATKDAYHSASAEDEAEEIARYMSEAMERDTTYVLGPGSTTAALAGQLGIEKTILGVDVVRDGKLVKKDAAEDDLTAMAERGHTKIIVSPIGAQGFIFGRGNQQISAKVIGLVGAENVVVIATPTKLNDTPLLHVDTGDQNLNRHLNGHIRVVVGYGRRRLVKVA